VARPVRYSRSELVGSSMVWLLRVDYASRSFLFSSAFIPADQMPEDDDGRPYTLAGSLGDMPDISEAFDLLTTSSSARSVSFRGIVFPIDIGAFIEAGHDLGAATGEVALWRIGDSYSDRLVWLTGRLSQPEYGAKGEPCAFSVEENPFDDLALIPSAASRASTSSLSGVETDDVGLYYPIVFGTPGTYLDEAGATVSVPGSMCVVVDRTGDNADTLVIAGHDVVETRVRIWSSSTVSEAFDVANTKDNLGNAVSTVDVSSASTIARGSDEFFCTWDAGGVSGPNGAVLGAGDLLEYFLQRSSLRLDAGRIAIARPALNTYKFSGYINMAVSPWQWIEVNLLPLIPASVVSGPGGIYPVVWKFDAVASDAIEIIDADSGIAVRDGPVAYEVEPSDVRNEFRIDFAPDGNTQSYQRFVTLKAKPNAAIVTEMGSYYAEVSYSRFGSAAATISSNIVYDDDTARAILLWKIRAEGFLHRSITYTLPKSFAWLGLGDVVELTDTDLSISARVALVQSIRWATEETISITLLVVDDPARDI